VDHEREELVPELTLPASLLSLTLGLLLLVASSELLVWGASNIAASLGVSELIIGLTIIALGTSLPELAASIASLRQGKPDLAIGNVIGSNLFNSLAVIGLPASFIRFEIDPSVPGRDLPVVIGLTLLLVLMSRFPGVLPRYLTRAKGLILFMAFVIYQLSLYYEAAVG
jgi:cation:H+ antiporter